MTEIVVAIIAFLGWFGVIYEVSRVIIVARDTPERHMDKVAEPTFDDRLIDLRDNFDAVYEILWPDPTKRPKAGVGWCPDVAASGQRNRGTR